jgi:hypothetical protein
MANTDVTIAWQFLAAILSASGVMIFLFESFRDWRFKRREEYIEQSKQKIDIISKAVPYYNQLAMNCWNFGWNLRENENPDYKYLMYFMCNMLHFRHEIISKFGDLQFDNLQAERIMNNLWQNIHSKIIVYFNYIDISKLRDLVNNDLPYHKFQANLNDENKELYDKFVSWLLMEISFTDLDELQNKCMWYSQLIMLELNHVYRLWYNEEPPHILDDGLKEYLKNNERKYYDRIK